MLPPITIRFPVAPARPSLAVAEVRDLFGLDPAAESTVVAENVALDVRPGDVVLFTGPSGSGKSTLLREVGRRLAALDAASLELPDVPLVEALAGPVSERLAALTACGLGEARLMLRSPGQLPDGQRARLRLALAFEAARRRDGDRWVQLDEFGAVLDRPLARVVAASVRKLAARHGVGVLAATTHDDLLADLAPDLHVVCKGDGLIEAERYDGKKKVPVWRESFGSPPEPAPTGRTSLGGITGATTSPTRSESSCSGTATAPPASASSALPPRVSPCGAAISG